MFCMKCGTKLSDTAIFCDNCGEKTLNSGEFTATNSTVKKKFRYKQVFIMLPLIIVIAIVSSLFIFQGATTPKKAVEIFFEATSDKNVSKLMTVLSDHSKNEIMDNTSSIPVNDKFVEEAIKSEMLSLEASTSEQLKQIKKINVRYCNNQELADVIEAYMSDDYSYYTTKDIKAFAYVFATFRDEEVNSEEMLCGKIGSKWYVIL